jgi:hypothetical protein
MECAAAGELPELERRTTMAKGGSGWVVGRYIWNGLIAAFGIVAVILGALDVWKNRKASNPLIVMGVTIVVEGFYMMFRRIPRFPDAGEEERSATMEGVDTVLIIVFFVIGCIIAGIVGAKS